MNKHMQEQQQIQAMGSGLTRYRSAPSSWFGSLLEGGDGFGSDDFERLFNPRAISPETQRIFSRFMNSGDAIQQPTKTEPCETWQAQSSDDYSMFHQTHNSNNNPASGDNRQSNRVAHNKIQRTGTNSGLIRHTSSPAGLFANIHIDGNSILSSIFTFST